MKTNEIDLTQCNNCRFRAVVDGKEVTGRIEKSKRSFLLTGDDVFGCAVTPAELENLLRGVDLTVEDEGSYISGFEIEPRDPETCKDWQVGVQGLEQLREQPDDLLRSVHKIRVASRPYRYREADNREAEESGVEAAGWRL